MIRYDFVIYGATGFTGQFVVDFVVRAEQEHGITWAVAGRSEDKLRAVLDRSGQACGKDLSSKPLIICECGDQSSLLAMASQAKVVLNCVGPFPPRRPSSSLAAPCTAAPWWATGACPSWAATSPS